MTSWNPPFCAKETPLDCPKCGAKGAVFVREKSTYFDADSVEAFCNECHADLEVTSNVTIEFSDAEVAHD